jgi:uncharacterized membrane protein
MMPEQYATMLTIGMMAGIVYLTRVSGYFIGLQFRHIGGLRPILEALPGCAMMAILVPAVRQGDIIDFMSLTVVLGMMWKTNNVVVSSVLGMAILLFGDSITNSF